MVKVKGLLSISEVNKLSSEQFVWTFGNVIETYKVAAKSVANKLPVQDVEHLCQLFEAHLDNLSKEETLKVLCLPPDLAGRLADTNQLSAESTHEQNSAELNLLNPHQKAKINWLNENYKQKFGFPFIICARKNKAKVIMEQLEVRYKNSIDEEMATGVREVKKILRLRIYDLAWDSPK